jgi:glycosyltransferase involved in cell wall biosynthesis
MERLAVAVCTYNRGHLLPELIAALRAQQLSIPFEIVVVDNNSQDDTPAVLAREAARPGAPLRSVHEAQQGITHARNRAIEACNGYTYMVFIDDDELPQPGWLAAAHHALSVDGADCVGGAIRVGFRECTRPRWLHDDLLGFLGEVKYGNESFWVTGKSTPVWTGNIAYRCSLFAGGLRFDPRYNREGEGVASGEDKVMFWELVDRGARIRFEPRMLIEHRIEPDRLRRSYFLKSHFSRGLRMGRFELEKFERTVFRMPPFLIRQFLAQTGTALWAMGTSKSSGLRQAMTCMHTLGVLVGCATRSVGR